MKGFQCPFVRQPASTAPDPPKKAMQTQGFLSLALALSLHLLAPPSEALATGATVGPGYTRTSGKREKICLLNYFLLPPPPPLYALFDLVCCVQRKQCFAIFILCAEARDTMSVYCKTIHP